MAKKMVQYLHFRILEFALNICPHWILTSSLPPPKNMWRQGATARLREDGLRGVGGHFLALCEWEHGMKIWLGKL